MRIKRLFTGLVLGAALIVLAGCGNQAPEAGKDQSLEKNQESIGPKADPQEVSKLPRPTGKVDDTISTIMDEADQEKAEALSDYDAAKSAVNDSQESGELINSVDINDIN